MKDSIDFYIKFIGEVEKNPILYNLALDQYNNRQMTEIIWTNIAKKFNESRSDCKSKWKCIRSAYIRSLNTKSKIGSSTGPKKRYYLAQYLKFLSPFIKKQPQWDNTPEREDEELSEHETQIQIDFSPAEQSFKHEISEEDSFSSSPHSSLSIQSPQPLKSRKRIDNEDKSTIEYSTQKKKRLEYEQQSGNQDDPCEMFLLCLVPHMKSMSEQQQLSFQRGVLDLIEDIKYRQHPQLSLENSPSNSNLSSNNYKKISLNQNHQPDDPLV